jgi:hypothetical protein
VVSVTDPYDRNFGFRDQTLLFLSSSSSIVFTRLSGPRSRPTNSQKIWQRRESNPDLWICSQGVIPIKLSKQKIPNINIWNVKTSHGESQTININIAESHLLGVYCKLTFRRNISPEDGGNTFLRKVSSYKTHAAPHSRRLRSS